MFDLRSLTWSSLKLKTDSPNAESVEGEDVSLRGAFPAISDHRIVSPLREEGILQSYLEMLISNILADQVGKQASSDRRPLQAIIR